MSSASANDPATRQSSDSASVHVARDQYDSQSNEYKATKQAPWRRHVERNTIERLVGMFGGVRAKGVLDLACGDGHYTRWLKAEQGAARVIGVDLSQAMIKLGEDEEHRSPLGVQYVCQDAALLEPRDDISVVFAAFLLNYASNQEELLRFARSIYKLLPPGGIFLTFQNAPHDSMAHHPELLKYGFTKTCEHPGQSGAPIVYTFFDEDGAKSCSIDNYALPHTMYEQAFRAAGFAHFGYSAMSVSKEGLAANPAGYWDALLDSGAFEGLFAQKD